MYARITKLGRTHDQGCVGIKFVAGGEGKKTRNTYNSGYSLVVTHLTTNPPVRCLNRAERTGSLVFNVLWSYVELTVHYDVYIMTNNPTYVLPSTSGKTV